MAGDCVFCKIVARRAPAHRVAEEARTLAFLDIFPVAPGHTLVIPRAHCESLLDADPESVADVARMTRRVAHAIHAVLAPDGIALHQLNGAAAGQSVFHYHMHLVPRMHGDPPTLHAQGRGEDGELATIASSLASALPPR